MDAVVSVGIVYTAMNLLLYWILFATLLWIWYLGLSWLFLYTFCAFLFLALACFDSLAGLSIIVESLITGKLTKIILFASLRRQLTY